MSRTRSDHDELLGQNRNDVLSLVTRSLHQVCHLPKQNSYSCNSRNNCWSMFRHQSFVTPAPCNTNLPREIGWRRGNSSYLHYLKSASCNTRSQERTTGGDADSNCSMRIIVARTPTRDYLQTIADWPKITWPTVSHLHTQRMPHAPTLATVCQCPDMVLTHLSLSWL